MTVDTAVATTTGPGVAPWTENAVEGIMATICTPPHSVGNLPRTVGSPAMPPMLATTTPSETTETATMTATATATATNAGDGVVRPVVTAGVGVTAAVWEWDVVVVAATVGRPRRRRGGAAAAVAAV